MDLSNEEKLLDTSNRKKFDRFNIENYKVQLKKQLALDKDVIYLSNNLDFNNSNNILEFGREAYNGIAQMSDEILKYLRIERNDGIKECLNRLTRIMESFDMNDFIVERESFFKRILKKQNSLEILSKKYNTLLKDIEKFYIELKYQQMIIDDSNKRLEFMLVTNIKYYELLGKYLLIGEKIKGKIEEKISNNNIYSELETINDKSILEMLEQRIEDFKIAEIIALETIITINEIENTNLILLKKIQSSFVKALPIFKNQLSQIIILKKHQLKLKSIDKIKEKSHKLTDNISNNNDISLLTKTFDNIMSGIEESKNIEEKNKIIRLEDENKLKELLKKYKFK